MHQGCDHALPGPDKEGRYVSARGTHSTHDCHSFASFGIGTLVIPVSSPFQILSGDMPT